MSSYMYTHSSAQRKITIVNIGRKIIISFREIRKESNSKAGESPMSYETHFLSITGIFNIPFILVI